MKENGKTTEAKGEAEKIEKVEKVKNGKKKVTPKRESDFKRKYFEYYDDVKISDRQDW